MKVFDPSALGLEVSKVNGLEAKLRCPFHFDKTPSAMFNLSSGLFHCFGCGYSSNAWQLAHEFGGELIKIEYASIPHFEDDREWRNLLLSRLAIDSAYLASRGVTREQIIKHGILKHREGVIFPVKNKLNQIIGLQERRFKMEPKYFLHGERTAIWPITNLKHEHLLLVEGVFGVLRAEKLGYNAVCTMGASAIPRAAKVLEGHTVKVAFDDDLAGYLGAYSFMRQHHTSSVALPGLEVDEAEWKDLDSVMRMSPTTDVMGYAMKIGNKTLVAAIRLKEQQLEKKKSRFNSITRPRKTSYR